ncbi:DUF4139 domain-containing protein [Fimbriimonas ginsengisoli]|uniref:DUF4139 domain-containing protein n=1 Tax=Fimbriimonas ginsengisoli Gsoil 348 TaxID=661478 RepID=A0A068NUX9_FIMGI|nr:DUF4139 domain-containing protein [Fimbriimonas ginsengisoli]AIE87162.1 hypothetical protein OP10G_3794 [Fimbriimonas ginsengisoli Gsoil 348]
MIAAAVMATAPSLTEVTVYNQGMGLVKETRVMKLGAGRQNVAVEDVAAMIDPSSVSVQSISSKGSFRVLEQNYQYDLISPMAILNKSVGQKVRFIRTIANQRDVLEGTLISAPTAVVGVPGGGNQQTYNGMVIRTDDGRIVLDPIGEIEVKSVPNGLISRPTLVWDLESAMAGENTVELSYITNGISWNSDYVLTLDGLGKAALQGWVTINNQCGATFENAKLKLLAGDVNRAPTAGPDVAMLKMAGPRGGGRDANFQEEGLFEYHLYTLQRPATVRNRETKQISLLESSNVTVQKRMIVDASMNFGRYYPGEGEIGTGDIKPQVRIEFENKKTNDLGIPLPRGRVRIYQRDQAGSVQLLGEDNIDHTPRDETVSLVVGRAFDVVASRKRTNFTRISDRAVQESFEIELRNRKETTETVEVIERHYGDWRVLAKNMDFAKASAEAMVFKVTLKPNEVRKVTYTVETKW